MDLCNYTLTKVFGTNLTYTPLIWAIEVDKLSHLVRLIDPDRYRDLFFFKSAYVHGNLLDPRSKSP